MDLRRFRALSAKQRAVVSVAVLLDGHEAGTYLENDAVQGDVLSEAALEVAELEPTLRMPFVGTMLRTALSELGQRD